MKFFLLLFFLLLAGCGDVLSTLKPPFTIAVIKSTAPTKFSDPVSFSLSPQTFPTLIDASTLEGPYLNLLSGGELSIHEVSNSAITDSVFQYGQKPSPRVKVKGKIIYPKDYNSILMYSAYFQFEEILANLESLIGISKDAIAARQPKGKFEILFQPKLTLESSTFNGTLIQKRNAAFLLGQGQVLLFEHSMTEKLPLASNLQVLAHEFGHAVFDFLFYERKAYENNVVLHNDIISGLNEGFADFFSFLVTGSTDILSGSISDTNAIAERNFAFTDWRLDNSDYYCHGGIYCLGSMLANSLYLIINGDTLQKDKLGKNIGDALKNARSKLDADKFLAAYYARDTLSEVEKKDVNSQVLSIFLQAFAEKISGADETLHQNLCRLFKEKFSLVYSGTRGCPL